MSFFEIYWPRWKSLVEFWRSEEREAAAIEIQRIVRGRRSRRIAIRRRRHRAARCIQRHCRGYLGRKRAKERRIEVLHDKSARRIQKTWTIYRAKLRHLQKLHLIKCCKSVALIERVYLGHLGRKTARRLRRDKQNNSSATEIQRIYRGYAAKLSVERMRRQSLEFVSARHIQRHFRGYQGRKVYQQKRREYQVHLRREGAAHCIQTYYRYYLGRKLQHTVNQYSLEMEMATVIRTAWRDYIAAKFGWSAIRYRIYWPGRY